MNETAIARIEPLSALPRPHTPTPDDMLMQAVSSGNLELAERMMALRERWAAGLAKTAYNKAIAAAKAEIAETPIIKNRQGHNGRYADLSAIAKVIDPILARHGLTYHFDTDATETMVFVTCVIAHDDGHERRNKLSAPHDKTGNKNPVQGVGSTTTYLERYTLNAALGLSAADDDDGRASGNGNHEAITDEQADEIRKLLAETKSNVDVFLKYIGAESVPDIRADQYRRAIAALNKKKAQE